MFGNFNSFRNWVRAHRVKVVLLALIVILVVAIAYGLVFFRPSQMGPKVTITSPPLEFSVELDKAEYQYGENISIKFCLRNISNNTVTIGKPSRWPIYPDYYPIPTETYGVSPEHIANGYFHFGFSITDQNGTEIFKQYRGYLPAVYDLIIQPGGYVKQTFIWQKTDVYPMPKGIYQIRGIFYGGVVGIGLITLETPSITFIIK